MDSVTVKTAIRRKNSADQAELNSGPKSIGLCEFWRLSAYEYI